MRIDTIYQIHTAVLILRWFEVMSKSSLSFFYARLTFSVLTPLYLIRRWETRVHSPNRDQELARATCPCPVCCGESESMSIMMPMSDEAEWNRAIPLTDHCGSATAFQLTHRLLWQRKPAARAAT